MSIRVIAVDNSEELLEKITRILKEMDDVEFCGSFGEAIAAIQYVKENPVDIVFSDVVMPDISGITLAARLAETAGKQDLSASGSAGGRASVRNTGIFPGGMEDPCIRIYY